MRVCSVISIRDHEFQQKQRHASHNQGISKENTEVIPSNLSESTEEQTNAHVGNEIERAVNINALTCWKNRALASPHSQVNFKLLCTLTWQSSPASKFS